MSSNSVKSFLAEYWQQIAVTSGGVFMTAGFAQHNGVLWWPFAWALAIGFEASWLRGLMQSRQTRSPWVGRMVVAGVGSVIVFGLLYCFEKYGVIPAAPGPVWGFWLAVAHVVPISVMTLCSALIHLDAAREHSAEQKRRAEAEREREQRLQAERDEEERERRRKVQELDLWERGQRVKASLRAGASHARPAAVPPQMRYPAPHQVYECPKCGSEMSAQEWGAKERHGERWRGCKACRQP